MEDAGDVKAEVKTETVSKTVSVCNVIPRPPLRNMRVLSLGTLTHIKRGRSWRGSTARFLDA